MLSQKQALLWISLLALLVSILVLRSPSKSSPPIVDLGYAKYQGFVDTTTNITTFLGMRYAAAPIRDWRFSAPQPPAFVAGVQQATTQPEQCFQARTFGTNSSEDCLVYYPSDAAGVPVGGLPTVVWIHGGGYVLGSASQFRGSDLLAQSNRGIVVVVIQYRLNVFGFLPGAEVKKSGTLNAGLLDQDFAFRWINKHISKFGGDPSKVTIWGESAGAGSVVQHIVANDGKTQPQLFRGAITSSTYMPSQYRYDDPIAESLYSQVVTKTNCTAAEDSLACLRRVDAASLIAAHESIIGVGYRVKFVPVVDGDFITRRPTLSLAQGLINGQALLSVTNAFEGTLFVNQAAPANARQYALDLFPKLDTTAADRVEALYGGLGTQLFQTNAIEGETILICPTYFLLRGFGGRAFKGEFAIPQGLHGRDLQYYFPSLVTDVPELGFPEFFNNADFIDAFAQSFISFAISLDPNTKIDPTMTPTWNQWKEGETEMVFNKTEDDVPLVKAIKTSDSLLERCQFWESIGELIGQ
ncbi:Alpha/Beta hydrolase protein [Mycena alexandri]|uniref:Carboxylic ester hydrolase n=1 Tax=Mycena alexandri TaxID=1745969 RepID=A0AAD6SZ70_9AGAR|nr:Alpha/Beta hydrolase protein [Mycena alexandri]